MFPWILLAGLVALNRRQPSVTFGQFWYDVLMVDGQTLCPNYLGRGDTLDAAFLLAKRLIEEAARAGWWFRGLPVKWFEIRIAAPGSPIDYHLVWTFTPTGTPPLTG